MGKSNLGLSNQSPGVESLNLAYQMKGGKGNISLTFPGLGSIQSGDKKPISRGGKPQSCLSDVRGEGGREISISSNLG